MKFFYVHLYSSDWAGIYDDYVVKAKSIEEVEESIDLNAWGADYEGYIDAEEKDIFYEGLDYSIEETSFEELIENGWTSEQLEEMEELGKENK